MQGFGITDVGKTRENNEDAIFLTNAPIGVLPNLFIVADGMGGHNAGEVASRLCVDFITDYVRDYEPRTNDSRGVLELLSDAIKHANIGIFMNSASLPERFGMGTTVTLCTIIGETAHYAHAGDSRLYALADELVQVSEDHTAGNELLKQKRITPEQAATDPMCQMLVRAVGTEDDIEVETGTVSGARAFLLCSDGLTNMLSDKEIQSIVESNSEPHQKLAALVDTANEKGGHDNISAILIVGV